MSDPALLPSPAFLAAFRRTAGTPAQLGFADFMRLALYDPEVGYYGAARRRVGRNAETDFYTASTSGAVFGELITAAAAKGESLEGLRVEQLVCKDHARTG